jgi:hypothetical protein
VIVDAQVHLWKADAPDRTWLPNRVAQLPEPFTVEQLVPMMDEAGVDRACRRPGRAIATTVRIRSGYFPIKSMPIAEQTVALVPNWTQSLRGASFGLKAMAL